MTSQNYYLYILSNQRNTTLYVGITSELKKRIWEHKQKLVKGFTQKYNLNKLVYFELCEELDQARTRERLVKKWKRTWKEDLINKNNPRWKDLYDEI